MMSFAKVVALLQNIICPSILKHVNMSTISLFYFKKKDTWACNIFYNIFYMPKYLEARKHEHNMVGGEHVEVVDHYKYKPRDN